MNAAAAREARRYTELSEIGDFEPDSRFRIPHAERKVRARVRGKLRPMQLLADHVLVGGVPIPFRIAQRWVGEYTSVTNARSTYPYAYPAYDRYETERNDPRRLTDADFLAPGLLNVQVKIRSYYALQRVRLDLEMGLANDDLSLPLAEIDDRARVAAMVAPLYGVLDDPQRRPWGVCVTTLSKVLHRKRPQSLVLHDMWVQRCYVGDNRPIQHSKKRTWAEYMVEITCAIGSDIRNQLQMFELLDESTSSPGDLTHARILDILAWKSQGVTPSEELRAFNRDGSR